MMESGDSATLAPTPPRARLPTRPVVKKIEAAGGLPRVLDRIVAGETQRVIAESLGVDRGDFSAWLNNVGGEEYREALRQSADGLMTEAEGILRTADASSMAGIQKAKMLAEHYYRLAGIRNARYRPNAPAVTIAAAEATGPAEMPRFTIVIAPQRQDLGHVIEHDPSDG